MNLRTSSPRRPALGLALAAGPRRLGVAIGLFVTIAVSFSYFAVQHVAYRDRVYPSVSVNGVPVGGLTRPEAAARLETHFQGYADRPLTLFTARHSWTLTPAELGLRTDIAGLVEEAYRTGRDGSMLERMVAPIALGQGTEVRAAPTLVPDIRDRLLNRLAADIDQAPVDARIVVADQTVSVAEGIPGQQLARDVTARRLDTAVERLGTEPIELTVESVPPTVAATDLQPAANQARLVLDRTGRVQFGDHTFPIDRATIRQALRFTGSGAQTEVRLDDQLLRPAITAIARTIDRPARDASLAVVDGRVELDSGQLGRHVQVGSSVRALSDALLSGNGTTALVVLETRPQVAASGYQSAKQEAEVILSNSVHLTARGDRWVLSPAELASLIRIEPPTAGQPATVSFDHSALAALVDGWAERIDQPAVAPKAAWNGGAVQLLQEGRRGQVLQREEALATVMQAARSEERTVELPVVTWGADLTQADVPGLGIKEEVAVGETSYAGSIPERAHNIELAAERLNGTLVAPGGQFSFNEAVGPTTLEAGFEWGYGIVNTGDGPRTVPSVAGGICQVATTLFQPVFWAGYQIDNRVPHSYWIPRSTSRGIPGLDTTVDEASGLDFLFTNNTSDYLLIESRTENGQLHFAVYGSKPNWTVEVPRPVIRDRVPADQIVVRETTAQLPLGETVWTEHAADGFTVQVSRSVTEPNGNIRRGDFTSRYQPARNVQLVGTGTRGGG